MAGMQHFDDGSEIAPDAGCRTGGKGQRTRYAGFIKPDDPSRSCGASEHVQGADGMKSVQIMPLVNSVAELAGDFDAHVMGSHEFPAVNVQAFAEGQRRGQNGTSA